jgi:hypothetical protein
MAERKRMPDTRYSITQKLHIRYSSEEEQLEWLVEKLRDKLRRINKLALQDIHQSNLEVLKAVAAVIDESETPPPRLQDVKIYMQVGLYPDTGKPGEIFLKADKMGTTISGLLDALSMSISVALQAGVPLEWFVEKMKNLQFSPAGPTNIPGIKKATSIVDCLARWLEIKFLPPKETNPLPGNLDSGSEKPYSGKSSP